MSQNQESGNWGEERAATFLAQQGFQILHRNWRALHLEIDLVAMHGSVLVIVEVKTRGTDAFGEPETFVNRTKQKNLIRAANLYLEQNRMDCEVRFDVVGIVRQREDMKIKHIADAFSPRG
jgi:putative endonuclease